MIGDGFDRVLARARDGDALVPYEAVAARVWELRDTVRPYDAWYVAASESFGVPLATLDARLVGAPGPECEFLTRS